MPVTWAPRRAMLSARMPPPQPTSSTRLPASPSARSIDVVQTQRIDIVQGLELAIRVPPAAGEFLEFGDFLKVHVRLGGCHVLFHWAAEDQGTGCCWRV
ncbi:MAG: hypothetical protein MZU84_05480 [Sphingobacterium sp.]|nr:hypothetical protein [Sphingobacterium sp.]